MNQAIFSTFAVLAGAVVGGLTTFATTWLTQIVQSRAARRAEEHARRQDLYGRFVDELAKLHGHALSADRVDYDKLPNIFALKGRIQLFAPPSVVSVCEASVRFIMDLYMAPPASPEYTRAMLEEGQPDWITEFARVASTDLSEFRSA